MGQTCAAVILKEEALSKSQVKPGLPYPHVGRTRQRQTREGRKIDQTFGTYWDLTLGVCPVANSEQHSERTGPWLTGVGPCKKPTLAREARQHLRRETCLLKSI